MVCLEYIRKKIQKTDDPFSIIVLCFYFEDDYFHWVNLSFLQGPGYSTGLFIWFTCKDLLE